MKKLVLLAALVVASLSMSVALASGTSTKFTATYAVGSSTWTCAGNHVVNKNSNKDLENCTISGDLTGYVLGTYSGAPVGTFPPFGLVTWASDDGSGLTATSWTIVLTDNLNGTYNANVVSYY